MNIKAFAFSAQRRIAEQLGISLKRSHIYESLAAAFGFASFASLCASSVFDVGRPERQDGIRTTDIARRLQEIGHSEVQGAQCATELAAISSEHGLHVVNIDHIIDSLLPVSATSSARRNLHEDADDDMYGDADDDAAIDDPDEWFDAWDISDFLRAGLEGAARRGNPKAHYALSLILEPEDEVSVGGSYWYDRQQQGEQLSGVQLEWAEAYRIKRQREDARLRHLQEAVRLGHPDACVDAAEKFEDPSFLKAMDGNPGRNPVHASEIAMELGQLTLAEHWCRTAAESGDVEAIRQMIDLFDRGDLLKCRTWLYFAQLLGTDLSESKYRLVHEDGSDYDDDVGGPGFPQGSEGIDLPTLDKHQDSIARGNAAALAKHLRKNPHA